MAMKEHHWSAYGFNPYCGGVDRMAKRLLKNPAILFYDVESWDRVLPIMPTVYSMRNRFFTDPVAYELAQWVAHHCIHTHLLRPDGLIFLKDIGNNSGSGNTTADNILAHSFILCVTLLDLYDGDTTKVKQVVAALFGDDNVMSLPLPKKGRDVVKTFERVFALFGLHFKPICLTLQLEGVEFLGFKFHRVTDGWIPQYNIKRLVAAFCYVIDKKHDVGASIARAWSLTVMSAGNGPEIFKILSSAVEHYLAYLVDDPNPVVKSYVEAGVPDYDSCIRFYLGRETSLPVQLFSTVGLEDENNYFYDGKCQQQEGWPEDHPTQQ